MVKKYLLLVFLSGLLLCGCMAQRVSSETETRKPDGTYTKTARYASNTVVWKEDLKNLGDSVAEMVTPLISSPLGVGILATLGIGGTAVANRGKRKSYNKGLLVGAGLAKDGRKEKT